MKTKAKKEKSITFHRFLRTLISLYFFISLTFVSSVLGQNNWTNSWIDYEQPYFKISSVEKGIYSLDFEELKQAGFPVETSPADQIQVFYRGQELAIMITNSSNNKLSSSSEILFYSEGNTGKQDSLVYRPHSIKPHLSKSLYSDNTYFYLTLSASQKGKRISKTGLAFDQTKKEKYHLARLTKIYNSEWSFNNISGLVPFLQQSYYEDGECWTGPVLKQDTLYTENISLPGRVQTAEVAIDFKAYINGRYSVNHNINCSIGDRFFEKLKYYGFGEKMVQTEIKDEEIDNQNTFKFKLQSENKAALELYSLNGYEVIYPQNFEWNGEGSKHFFLRNDARHVAIELSANQSSNFQVWDISNPAEPIQIDFNLNNSQIQFALPPDSLSREIVVSKTLNKASKIEEKQFEPFTTGYDYVIISHDTLWSSAQSYADYRSSEEGGSFNVLLANIKDIQEQFNYGERSPIGIRNFLDFQLSDGQTDKYLLLIGNGVSFPDLLKSWQDRDFIPTFGYPGSDLLLSAGLGNSLPDQESFRTGRLSSKTNEQVLDYLEKVKEKEHSPFSINSKKIIHLSGGKTLSEINSFKKILANLGEKAEQSAMAAQVEYISKTSGEPVQVVDISKQANSGFGLLTFMGHATPKEPDMNIGYVSSPSSKVENKGNYPLLYFTGCGVGNVFYRYETIATDWLMAKQRGAIAVLANSFWSYPSVSTKYLNHFYASLFDDPKMAGKPIAEVVQYTNKKLILDKANSYDLANVHQLILLGDPALKLFPIDKVNFQTGDNRIFIQSQDVTKNLAMSDSLSLGVIVGNTGHISTEQTLQIAINRTFENGTKLEKTFDINPPVFQDTLYFVFENKLPLSEISVLLDANQKFDENDETDNLGSLIINWDEVKSNTLFPESIVPDELNPILSVFVNQKSVAPQLLVQKNPVFLINIKDNRPLSFDKNTLQIYVKKEGETDFSLQNPDSYTVKTVSKNELELSLQTDWQNGNFEVLLTAQDASGNKSGSPITFTVSIAESGDFQPIVFVSPNPSIDYAKIIWKVETELPQKKNAELKIFSQNGQLIEAQEREFGTGHNEMYCLRHKPAGVYIYQLKLADKIFKGRIVLD